MALKLVTAASAPLVSLVDAKKHLNIFHDDDDDYIKSLVEVAASHIDGAEGWLGRAFGRQSWELSLDVFPPGEIRLPLPPLQEVTEVAYTKDDGTAGTVVDFREFGVGSVGGQGFVLPAYGERWPTTRNEPEAVRVKFTAGYEALPAQVGHAVKLLIGAWYEHREDASEIKLADMPRGVDALLIPLRFWPF